LASASALRRLRARQRGEEADQDRARSEAADRLRVRWRDRHDDVAAPHLRRVARDLRARVGVRRVGQQGVGARAALHDDVKALGLELAHDLWHERHTMLARSGLLRNTYPHEVRERIRSYG
jgi:hypothetical protein